MHCLSHRCALVGFDLVLKDSVEKGEWALWCDEIMHDTINPFARSSERRRELEKAQKEMELVKLLVLRLVVTRSLSRGQCLHRTSSCLIYPASSLVQQRFRSAVCQDHVAQLHRQDGAHGRHISMLLQLASAINTLLQATHVYIKFAMDDVKKNFCFC